MKTLIKENLFPLTEDIEDHIELTHYLEHVYSNNKS